MAKQHTVYAKATGVEFKAVTKTDEKKPGTKYGAIQIRFFGHKEKSKTTPMVFHVTNQEAHAIGRTIALIVAGKKDNRYFTHKFTREGVETETSFVVEKWKNKDGSKSGYGFAIKRGEDGIPVPCPEDEFLFVCDFLKDLAIEQSWETYEGEAGRGENRSGAQGSQPAGSSQPSGGAAKQEPPKAPDQSSSGGSEYDDYDPL